MSTAPRPPLIKHNRTYHTERKTNKAIPGNCYSYRPVFLCWPTLSNHSRLTLIGLISSHDTTSQITAALQQRFCRTAIPDIIWSDSGPQFTSIKFNQFSQQWGFRTRYHHHITPRTMEKLNIQSKR